MVNCRSVRLADVEHAEQRLRLQRDAGRAAHVAAEHLADDDVDLREVVEHDGLAALGDAVRRSPRPMGTWSGIGVGLERGAAALDELATRFVEQQHANGVALQQRGDAAGNLREQLVERQAREARGR